MIAMTVQMRSSLVTKRGHNQIMRRLNRQFMTRVRDNLPRHFERNTKTAPGGAYGYEKRGKRYQIRKAKTKGHQIPNVFTGRLKQAIMSNVKITATAGRGRLRTRGYFPMKTQRRSEIETIAPDEKRDLMSRMGRDYALLAQRSEYQKKKYQK